MKLKLSGSIALAITLFVLSIIPVSAQTTTAQSRYYYYMGEAMPLEIAPEVIALSLRDGDTAQQLNSIQRLTPFLIGSEATTYPDFTLITLSTGEGRTIAQDASTTRAIIDQLSEQTGLIEWVNPVFRVPVGYAILTDELIAQFPADWSDAQVQQFSSQRGLEVVSELLSNDNTFVLRTLIPRLHNALDVANALQESGEVIYAEPNFATFIEDRLPPQSETPDLGRNFIPNDPFFSQQWFLNNTGQTVNGVAAGTPDADIDAVEAWDITRGDSDIIIAIVDDAFDPTHVDLGTGTSKQVPGYDAPSGVGNIYPTPGSLTAEAHGTSTAGLAAANGNNSEGVSGVCPNCRLMAIDIFNGDPIATSAQIANGFTYAWQNGADVISNSWGTSTSTTLTNAINLALSSGRGGLGSVVVFAAGNTSGSPVIYPGSLTQVITVAASNLCDQRKSTSGGACNYFETWGPNSGPQVDVSAPGVGLYTSDIMGTGGYGPGNYEPEFNGTSGSTPIVSGMIGLVLSQNPTLTAVQVQQLVKDTADDIETAGFDNGTGFGRINARRAVETASATLNVQLTLQGRPAAPNNQWIATVNVKIRPVGGVVFFNSNFVSTNLGQVSIPNLPVGTYEVLIKGSHTLARLHTITLVQGTNALTTAQLMEGDANNDNIVSLPDFSLLASAFATEASEPAYNAAADFNVDGFITLPDFSLLANSYGASGDS